MSNERIAMFELAVQDDTIVVAEERHYKLVPATQLDASEIQNYR